LLTPLSPSNSGLLANKTQARMQTKENAKDRPVCSHANEKRRKAAGDKVLMASPLASSSGGWLVGRSLGRRGKRKERCVRVSFFFFARLETLRNFRVQSDRRSQSQNDFGRANYPRRREERSLEPSSFPFRDFSQSSSPPRRHLRRVHFEMSVVDPTSFTTGHRLPDVMFDVGRMI